MKYLCLGCGSPMIEDGVIRPGEIQMKCPMECGAKGMRRAVDHQPAPKIETKPSRKRGGKRDK